MKLKDLKDIVDKAIENGGEDLKVCIPNNKSSIGFIAATEVKSAGAGFDWNKHLFILWPENEMNEIEDE